MRCMVVVVVVVGVSFHMELLIMYSSRLGVLSMLGIWSMLVVWSMLSIWSILVVWSLLRPWYRYYYTLAHALELVPSHVLKHMIEHTYLYSRASFENISISPNELKALLLKKIFTYFNFLIRFGVKPKGNKCSVQTPTHPQPWPQL